MSTTGRAGDRHIPLLSWSHELVAMIREVDLRISSGPAASGAALTGRAHDRTQTGCTSCHFSLAPQGPSTHDMDEYKFGGMSKR